jgi:hypothetical protein
LLLPISLGPNEAVQTPGMVQIWGPDKKMRREIAKCAPWLDQNEIEELIQEITDTPTWKRKPKARTIGRRLQVTYPERQRLQLKTIGPCDMSETALALIRQQKKRQRERRRRELNGAVSRADYLVAHSLSKQQPWTKAGMSRATWYRQQRETGPCPINLNKTEHALVSNSLSQVADEEIVAVLRRLPLLGRLKPVPVIAEPFVPLAA